MDPNDPRHGTVAGQKAHRRAHEKPCDPCRQAANELKRQKRAEGKIKVARCTICGRTRRDDHVDRGKLCRDCASAGAVRPVDLDIDIDPPNWVRRGLIWVAA